MSLTETYFYLRLYGTYYSYKTTFRHNSLDNFLVKILHTHACFEKRGEYVVLSASSKNGGSSTAGPMGMVTQVPTKTYAGLYTFKCVYKHYIPIFYSFHFLLSRFYPNFICYRFVCFQICLRTLCCWTYQYPSRFKRRSWLRCG